MTTRMRAWKRTLWLLFALIAAVLALLIYSITSARIERTESGVHRRLLLPLAGGREVAFPIYSGTADRVLAPGYLEGPVVRMSTDGAWKAKWFCEDDVGTASGRSTTFVVDCAGRQQHFSVASAPVPASNGPMPAAVTVLSDLEGNLEFLTAALPSLKVTDQAGNWSYGKGHLVILGDSVDRGRDVSAVLWRLHALAIEAHRVGGAVHFVLGNHEQYLLRGNNSRANPETIYALNQLGGYTKAFANDTVLGRWLRAQPVILKLGTTLFAHGGVSREVANFENNPAQLNQLMREYWQGDARAPRATTPGLDAVLGLSGLTQYRGYMMAVEGRYGLADDADVSHVLQRFGADRIVIAHTPVRRVEALFNARVYAIDVNEPGARSQVLTFNHGRPRVVDIPISRNLEKTVRYTYRDFNPKTAGDREILSSMIRQARALSTLPHPY